MISYIIILNWNIKNIMPNQRSTKHFPAPHMTPVVLLLLQNR